MCTRSQNQSRRKKGVQQQRYSNYYITDPITTTRELFPLRPSSLTTPPPSVSARLIPPPPTYEEVTDLEKALISPPEKAVQPHVSTYSIPSSPSYTLPSPHHKHTQDTSPISLSPPRRHIRIIRHLRYAIFTVYRRLFTLVFLLNSISIPSLLHQWRSWTSTTVATTTTTDYTAAVAKTHLPNTLATLASSNFLLAVLIRQDHLIELLFRAAWLVPWHVPLSIRQIVARVYCYGGIHSGAAVAGTMWWLVFSGVVSWDALQDDDSGGYTAPVVRVAWVVFVVLGAIVVMSVPGVREKYHDVWEVTHRWLGWLSISLFWVQVFLRTASSSTFSGKAYVDVLVHTPTFWNLCVITALLVCPWLRLRRWTFTAHPLSVHAVRLSFTYPVHKFCCLSIATAPLGEWHPFATFPSSSSSSLDSSTSMIISSAGDWTSSLISHVLAYHSSPTDPSTPPHSTSIKSTTKTLRLTFYTKSHPKPGVLSLSTLFPRVLLLTTGSGIGPCLSSLLDKPLSQHARLIWSSRSPLKTYGAHILSLVSEADPDAVVLDTDELGRPDLLEVAWKVCRLERVQAVFVLSNKDVTSRVVGELERRGVLAFGPIWDS